MKRFGCFCSWFSSFLFGYLFFFAKGDEGDEAEYADEKGLVKRRKERNAL